MVWTNSWITTVTNIMKGPYRALWEWMLRWRADLSRRLWGLFWGRCVLAEVWKMNRSYFPVVRKTGTVGWKDCCVCEGSKEKRSRIYSRNWKPTGGWTTEGKLQSLVRWAQNNRVYWLIAVLLWGSYLTSLTIITVLTSHGCYED